ncbi:Glycosyltransferase Family 4 [Andreprevotia lacus DSM 23236]|jgi:glycosyltransferase involved in cell wall biosynthesis|uniref:Glycosyltransferase Family 4 n=1 Tax=Andreprevotia lacus DSM 23236 TaxID=1121001 RepID=A0A1W1XHZ1_9NEIS|nr:glycosyltransferase family 4 protein [Andreprevotia lacus]SMC23402.1 Glycosyltransferase Family 4 [Andreprevotia lacus DSM 23236]
MPKADETAQARLRIALILTEFPPHYGGMQTHAAHLAAALHARGHQIRVYTYRSNGDAELADAESHDRSTPYPVQRVLSRIGYWFNHALLTRQLTDEPCDLVYASNVYYGLLGPALKVPVICRSVGNDVLRPWIIYPFRLGSGVSAWPWLESTLYRLFRRCNSPEWIEALLRRARSTLMQGNARAATHILANSAYTTALLQSVGVHPTRLQQLPGGVDCAAFAPPDPATRDALRAALGLPPGTFVLFTACRLVAKKGVDFLLQQMPTVRQHWPAARLLIAGDGRERRRCEALAQQLGIGDAVTFLGRLPHEQLRRYYWACDVFVLASRITRNRYSGQCDAETMGRVLCEANAAGAPVLASNSGGIPSVIRHNDNGLLFEADNAADLLAQLQRLHDDAPLLQRLRERGLERARKEFDWPHILRAHEHAFAATRVDEAGKHAAALNTQADTLPSFLYAVGEPSGADQAQP